MSENKVCIICNKGETGKKKLANNPESIKSLFTVINERIDLGESDLKPILLRFSNLSITEQKNVWYHSECRKPLVNVRNVERLRTFGLKRSDSLPDITEDSEQPSTSTESVRPKSMHIFTMCFL